MKFRPFGIAALLVLCTWAAGTAQVATGTLYQSIDPLQGAGVSQVLLPGNPSITTNEILAWSSADGGGARALFNAQALSLLLGDQNGDGALTDLPDVDALAVGPVAAGTSPSPYDFRFSVSGSILGSNGATLVTPGDVFALAAGGGYGIVASRAQFQQALGTTAPLDVDAYAEIPGAVLVSFRGTGSGSNIISPLSGAPGFQTWTGSDVFIVRQPVGLLPAIFAYRTSELQPPTQMVLGSGYLLSEVVGVDVQPNTVNGNNPWDPQGAYAGGTRPEILWTVRGDENVIAWNPFQNPLGNTFLYALVEGSQGAGYATNTSSSQVAADALAFSPTPLGDQSRITVDHSNSMIAGGGQLTLILRSALGSGETFQLVAATQREPGIGLVVGNPGYPLVQVATFDPLVYWSLQPPLQALLMTGTTDGAGTAQTVPLTMPFVPGPVFLYFQAFRLGGSFPLSSPVAVRIL